MIARALEQVNEAYGGGNAAYVISGSGTVTDKRFHRSILTGSPMPRSPSFDSKLGTWRLINAASLLSQQLHSLKRTSFSR
jgi:hypothetical protein